MDSSQQKKMTLFLSFRRRNTSLLIFPNRAVRVDGQWTNTREGQQSLFYSNRLRPTCKYLHLYNKLTSRRRNLPRVERKLHLRLHISRWPPLSLSRKEETHAKVDKGVFVLITTNTIILICVFSVNT